MRLQGKVLNWNDTKGFGFVEPSDKGAPAFVHIKAFESQARRPANGDAITYERVRENNNRYKAINVRFVRDAKRLKKRHSTNGGRSFGHYFILIFVCALLASTFIGKLPLIITGLYFLMSVVTFIAYAIDKSAAKNSRWRTQETTLHILSLIGGWPGAFFAQNTLRHKSSKKHFKRVYIVTVLLNVATLVGLHTEKAAAALNKILPPLLGG